MIASAFSRRVRRGFTLLELLIVIVVIGVLAAAMLLSTGSASASARVSAIISDLRGLRSAALMLYMDSADSIADLNVIMFSGDGLEMLARYTDNPERFTRDCEYSVFSDPNSGEWWALCRVDNDGEFRDKLSEKAASIGLMGSSSGQYMPYDGGPICYIKLR